MKDAKMLLIIKNCSIELAEKIVKVIEEYNAAKRKKSDNERVT